MRPRPPGTLLRWAVGLSFLENYSHGGCGPWGSGQLRPSLSAPWQISALTLFPINLLERPQKWPASSGVSAQFSPTPACSGPCPTQSHLRPGPPSPGGGIPISGSITPRVAFRGPGWQLSLSSSLNVLRAEGQESRGARPGPVFLFAAPIPSLQGLESSLQSPQITGPSFSGWGCCSLIRGSGSPWWNAGRNREPEAVLPRPHLRPTLAGAREDCSQS